MLIHKDFSIPKYFTRHPMKKRTEVTAPYAKIALAFHFPLPTDCQSILKSFVKLFNPKIKRLKHVTYKQVKRPQKTRQYFFIRYVSVSWLNKSSPRVSSKAMDQYSPSRRYDRKISFTFIGIQSGSNSMTSSLSSADHSHCLYGTIWLTNPA